MHANTRSTNYTNGHRADPTASALGERTLEAVAETASRAQWQVHRASFKTGRLMKAHPLKAAGILIGVGVVLGITATRLFWT